LTVAASAIEFEDSVAIVTGASKGIGKAVAGMLAARGAAVVLVGRGQDSLDAAAHEIVAAGGLRVATVAGDAARSDTGHRAASEAVRAFGRLNILANIAGAFPTALLEQTDDESYAQTISANLTATFAMCRAALPSLRANGSGAIVNMSSTAARLATPGLSVYGASKAGIEAFTRAVALESAPIIRVNAVSAGPTLTETVVALMASDKTGAVDAVTKSIPLQRMANVSEIAEAVVFLASRRSSFVTGQVLHVNGGGVMA
jgi:NAD(P)-dependent dehydrogenase (short-subunit alcohol dehydrogenase family)